MTLKYRISTLVQHGFMAIKLDILNVSIQISGSFPKNKQF
jgi:hypothetical protein